VIFFLADFFLLVSIFLFYYYDLTRKQFVTHVNIFDELDVGKDNNKTCIKRVQS
jgi:hypothetical protein